MLLHGVDISLVPFVELVKKPQKKSGWLIM